MKFKYLPIFCVLAIVLPGLACAGPDKDYEKRISETFSIQNDGRVRLDNRYGEIKVVTWSQSRVKIDVLIRVNASSEDDFKKVLERIDIQLNGGGNSVSAVTNISSSRSGNSWWNLFTGGGSSDDFKIYYTVSMPASVSLEVDARYCDVELPDLSGETYLDVGYGDLVAGRLSNRSEIDISYGTARVERIGDNSSVKFRYSDGSIRNGEDIRYDGRYSEVRFGKVGVLRLDAGYEEIEVESATEVYLDGNYNELAVERAASVYIDASYTDINLGTITKSVEFTGNYGEIDIDQLAAGFDRVDIRASYSDVEIDVDDDAGYTLDLSARYGDIDVPTGNLSSRKVGTENGTDYVRGTKSGPGGGTIRVTTQYGDIDIY